MPIEVIFSAVAFGAVDEWTLEGLFFGVGADMVKQARAAIENPATSGKGTWEVAVSTPASLPASM